jgi:hypothetical protein
MLEPASSAGIDAGTGAWSFSPSGLTRAMRARSLFVHPISEYAMSTPRPTDRVFRGLLALPSLVLLLGDGACACVHRDEVKKVASCHPEAGVRGPPLSDPQAAVPVT